MSSGSSPSPPVQNTRRVDQSTCNGCLATLDALFFSYGRYRTQAIIGDTPGEPRFCDFTSVLPVPSAK